MTSICLECWGKGFIIRIPEQYNCTTNTCTACNGKGKKEETK